MCGENEKMKFREMEKILLADGWEFKNVKGSHYHYVHPVKPGKVTVPNHPGEISPIIVKAILKQAGL
jgi:predicted RNA binding protein YcfA (HicA-like mRNA interferase family)